MNTALREAAARANGVELAAVPDAHPHRPRRGAAGDCVSALPLRLAGTVGRPAAETAAATAAELRASGAFAAVSHTDRGFLSVTCTTAAWVALAGTVARNAAEHLTEGRWDGTRDPATEPPAVLADAGPVAEARRWARADARRRLRSARAPVAAAPAGMPPAAATDDVTWRDPYLDAPAGGTESARLLNAVGEASARIAFCRSSSEELRPGEETGPGLPALPNAHHPGDWAWHTASNPAFCLRYAHAHAVATRQWTEDAGLPPASATGETTRAGEAALDTPSVHALLGKLFDAPAMLEAAGRRGQPHLWVRYLETLAVAYHEWRGPCGVIPGETTGREAADAARRETAARLDLCAAAAGVLRTGLFLLGVSAPTRL
ncbi:DALR anticodon-binding domain-containing protein [Haloactinospora alba]|uniref:DALR anticodon-binding domain-containing protein n=1 Tax=Haloactinospora alba TaxID=405555 RepID=UPI001FE64533|nr:DALR anticodon-binding domain-containing protein [Haloactinospora alba]